MQGNLISIIDLKKKQRELEQVIEKANNEKEHIDYVLRHFSLSEKLEEGSNVQMKIPVAVDMLGRREKLEMVKGIMAENGYTMRNMDTFHAMEKRGVHLKKTTFDAYMSQWSSDDRTGIRRIASGIYELSIH